MKEEQLHFLRSCLNNGKGGDHFSPTQIGKYKTMSDWCVEYLAMDQDQRRKEKKKYKVGFGSVVGNVAQKMTSKYIFEGPDKVAVKEQKIEEAFKQENETFISEPFDQEDKEIRMMLAEIAMEQTKNAIRAYREVFGHQPTQSERYVHTSPEGLFVDILGRLDWESALSILELKSKPPSVKWFEPKKGDPGYRFYTQTIPKDPSKNIDQVAFYYAATKKEPHICYVNEKEYVIFDSSHEMLKPDYLEEVYQQMLNKAFKIQKLLILSNGDPKEFASLTDMPDLTNWMYQDASEEKKQLVKQLWMNQR